MVQSHFQYEWNKITLLLEKIGNNLQLTTLYCEGRTVLLQYHICRVCGVSHIEYQTSAQLFTYFWFSSVSFFITWPSVNKLRFILQPSLKRVPRTQNKAENWIAQKCVDCSIHLQGYPKMISNHIQQTKNAGFKSTLPSAPVWLALSDPARSTKFCKMKQNH